MSDLFVGMRDWGLTQARANTIVSEVYPYRIPPSKPPLVAEAVAAEHVCHET